VLVAVGGALVVGGIASGIVAKQDSDNLTRLDQMMQAFNSTEDGAGRTAEVLEGVFIGVGAAAAVAGVALLVVGQRERSRSRRLALTPYLSLRAALLSHDGRF
jgi:hypothetical protein